ncbi:CopG family transcriptional regulator [Streptococcus pluranimalium]
MKKRLTITLSESVRENHEKMEKEMGLSKAAKI